MESIKLLLSTGQPKIDKIIEGVIGLFELDFPGRVRCYYLIGSYSDQSEIATSDLDLVTIFKEKLSPVEDEQVDRFCDYCNQFCPVDLDFNALGENNIPLVYTVLLKQAALPLYGEDIREKISLPPVKNYARRILHNSIGFSFRMRNWSDTRVLPLDFPDPKAEFYGYANRKLILRDGSEGAGIKDLVVMAGWAATALVGLKTGQYVARKSESFQKYRMLVNDEWAGLLDKINRRCRGEWHYQVPDSSKAQAELKEICQEFLAFENYCFTIYEEVILADLTDSQPPEKLLAIRRAGLIDYGNPEIKERLLELTQDANPAINQTAAESQERLNWRN